MSNAPINHAAAVRIGQILTNFYIPRLRLKQLIDNNTPVAIATSKNDFYREIKYQYLTREQRLQLFNGINSLFTHFERCGTFFN